MLLDLFGVVGVLVVYAVMSAQAVRVLTARPHGEWNLPGSHFQAWRIIAALIPAGIAAFTQVVVLLNLRRPSTGSQAVLLMLELAGAVGWAALLVVRARRSEGANPPAA